MEVTFYEAGCKPFFKKHRGSKRIVKQKISAAIDKEVKTGMSKVKLATPQKINDLPCYEFRLNVGKIGSVRIAFTVRDAQATVYLITTDLQKSSFSEKVDRFFRDRAL